MHDHEITSEVKSVLSTGSPAAGSNALASPSGVSLGSPASWLASPAKRLSTCLRDCSGQRSVCLCVLRVAVHHDSDTSAELEQRLRVERCFKFNL